jgi:PAB1-binding protein PBP1
MQRVAPFARARAMMAAITAVMAAFPIPGGTQAAALNGLGPYESRGKGGKRPHRRVGTKINQRAALKRRNRARSK